LSLVIAAVALRQAILHAHQLFVGVSIQPVLRPLPTVLRAEAEEEEQPIKRSKTYKDDAVELRGIDLDGDKLDNLDEWYEETITEGQGGKPVGFLRDLVLRSFFGEWSPKGYFRPSREFTGERKQPCEADYETAYQIMKRNIMEKKHFMGQDDLKGWTWLAAGQNPAGLFLYTTKSPPYGDRPLAIIKDSDPEEFFAKVNWERLYIRLHKWNLWGGKAQEFPYPVAGEGLPR